MNKPLSLFVAMIMILSLPLAAEEAAPAQPAEQKPGEEVTVRRGGVVLYPAKKRIEMEGKFVLPEGPVEYFAVTLGGKEYESLIAVDAVPSALHLALIVIGMKPGLTGPKVQGDPENAPTGDPVTVKVKWKDANGVEKIVRAEELCWSNGDRRTMETTPWVFAGSKKEKDPETGKEYYVADVQKGLIAVYRDPFAVLDLPLSSSADDEMYTVNKDLIPPAGTPCTIIIEPAPPIAPPAKNADGGKVWLIDVSYGGRILVDGILPQDLNNSLAELRKQYPKDTFRLTVDHGAPPGAAASAIAALQNANCLIESVATVRPRNVQDVMTITLKGDEAALKGEKMTPRQIGDIVRATIAGGAKEAGVVVRVEQGNSFKMLAEICRNIDAVRNVVLKVEWPEKAPK